MATLAEVASSDEAADVAAGVKAAAEHAFHLRTGDTVMLLLTLTVVFRLIKHHWFRAVPTSIFMSIAAVASTSVLLAVTYVRPPTPGVGVSAALDGLKNFLMDFPDLLLNYMLGFLLFAAAIEVDLRALSRIRTTVFALSVFSTAISTLLVASLTYLLLLRIAPMDFMWCLLFGSIVSPTDPVAVVAILNDKPDLIPLSTRYFVLGESLFNDAVGVVLYLGFVETVEKPDMPVLEVLRIFARGFALECATGIVIGGVLSFAAYSAMLTVEDSLLEVTITIVLVSNINLACSYFHASIPLASVVAGLLIGNYGVADAMTDASSALFHQLWSFLDETLNSVLFLLIGAADLFWRPQDIGMVPTTAIVAGTVCISLFARAVSVATPLLAIVAIETVTKLRLRHRAVRYRGGTIGVLTWGGMRGGISIALALGVPDAFVQHALPGHLSPGQVIFLMTFTLVLFSLGVQGLLFEPFVNLFQDLSYVYLPHGGLSTFKSSMSLNFDGASHASQGADSDGSPGVSAGDSWAWGAEDAGDSFAKALADVEADVPTPEGNGGSAMAAAGGLGPKSPSGPSGTSPFRSIADMAASEDLFSTEDLEADPCPSPSSAGPRRLPRSRSFAGPGDSSAGMDEVRRTVSVIAPPTHTRWSSSTFDDLEPLAPLPNMGDLFRKLQEPVGRLFPLRVPGRGQSHGGGSHGGTAAGHGRASGAATGSRGLAAAAPLLRTVIDEAAEYDEEDPPPPPPTDEPPPYPLRRSVTAPVGSGGPFGGHRPDQWPDGGELATPPSSPVVAAAPSPLPGGWAGDSRSSYGSVVVHHDGHGALGGGVPPPAGPPFVRLPDREAGAAAQPRAAPPPPGAGHVRGTAGDSRSSFGSVVVLEDGEAVHGEDAGRAAGGGAQGFELGGAAAPPPGARAAPARPVAPRPLPPRAEPPQWPPAASVARRGGRGGGAPSRGQGGL